MTRSGQSRRPAGRNVPGGRIRNRRIRNRTLVPLPELLHKRWLAYAIAAGAGVLAANQPAQASIIYTPANINFTAGTVFIDLNHDGINDFKFTGIGGTNFFSSHTLSVNGNGNRGAAVIGKLGLASALSSGAVIGRGGAFRKVQSASLLMAKEFVNSSSSFSFRGNWANVTDKFLGLRFLINGQAHFGWAEFSVVNDFFSPIDTTLLGYAYNTVPSQKITAGQTSSNQPLSDSETNAGAGLTATPEPATLGLLALGSLGLAAWRRRKREPLA